MRILLPYPCFSHSVACMDRVRLGNQRIAAIKMLTTLISPIGLPKDMLDYSGLDPWRDHLGALAVYATMANAEWEHRGYEGALVPPYGRDWQLSPSWANPLLPLSAREARAPAWVGDEAVHAEHREVLLKYRPEHYRLLGWT